MQLLDSSLMTACHYDLLVSTNGCYLSHLHSHHQKVCVSNTHMYCVSQSPSSGTLFKSIRLSFSFLLSVRGEGSQLSGGVGWAWGEREETSRLAGLKYLRKPSKACFTQSVPSGTVPSETNYNFCWATDEGLNQRKQCTEIYEMCMYMDTYEHAHTKVCTWPCSAWTRVHCRHTQLSSPTHSCTFFSFSSPLFLLSLSPALSVCLLILISVFLNKHNNPSVFCSSTKSQRLHSKTHRDPHTKCSLL